MREHPLIAKWFPMVKAPRAFNGRCVVSPGQDRADKRRQYDAARRKARDWRGWYALSRWCGPDGRRAQQLAAQPLCEACLAADPPRIVQATVAHHRIEHNGDPWLFWHGELESSCKPCHDRDRQREERRGGG